MPRMHVWLIGTATLTATSYVAYTRVYLPRATSQREFEEKLTSEGAQLRRVMQAYAQLKASIDQAEARAITLAGAYVITDRTRSEKAGAHTTASPSQEGATADTIDYERLVAGGGMHGGESSAATLATEGPAAARRGTKTEPSAAARAHMPVSAAAVKDKSDSKCDDEHNVPHHSLCVFRTNREKLLLYLHIQRVRSLLRRLPLTAQQTEGDLTEMMVRLDEYEQTHCCTSSGRVVARAAAADPPGVVSALSPSSSTPVSRRALHSGRNDGQRVRLVATVPPENGLLNFRDAPLTISQRGRSCLGYVLYCTCFHVLPWLLSWCPQAIVYPILFTTIGWPGLFSAAGRGEWRAVREGPPELRDAVCSYRLHAAYHVVARFIVRLLEVEVAMALPAEGASVYGGRPDADGNDNVHHHPDGDGGVRAGDLSRVQYFVMNPTHWIEEVGFWACPENPLLLPPAHLPRERRCSLLVANDCVASYRLKLLSAPPVTALTNLCQPNTRSWWMRTAAASTTNHIRNSLFLLLPSSSPTGPAPCAISSSIGVSSKNNIGSLREPTTWVYLIQRAVGVCARPTARAFPVDYGVYWAAALADREQHLASVMERLRHLSATLRGGGGSLEVQGKLGHDHQNEGIALSDDGDGETVGRKRRSDALVKKVKTDNGCARWDTVTHGRSSYGYPLAIDAAELMASAAAAEREAERRHAAKRVAHREGEEAKSRSHDGDDCDGAERLLGRSHAPCYAPVGLAGLPRVLYINEIVARSDSGSKSSHSHVYDHLTADQYGLTSGSKREHHHRHGNTTCKAPGEVESSHALAASATAEQLTMLQQQRGVPFYLPLWWSGVFGGTALGGNRARRRLVFQLGRTSDPEELTEQMLAVSEQAVMAAYA